MDTHLKYFHVKKRNTQNTTPDTNRKWATFTYIGKETRAITKLFKNTNLHIAYKTKKHFTKTPSAEKHRPRQIQPQRHL
jgi:hypothetical protein